MKIIDRGHVIREQVKLENDLILECCLERGAVTFYIKHNISNQQTGDVYGTIILYVKYDDNIHYHGVYNHIVWKGIQDDVAELYISATKLAFLLNRRMKSWLDSVELYYDVLNGKITEFDIE